MDFLGFDHASLVVWLIIRCDLGVNEIVVVLWIAVVLKELEMGICKLMIE
jgi:hypothetical protein